MNVQLRAIQKNKINALRNQLSWWTQSFNPIIFIISLSFNSFSSTMDFTSLDTGYNVAITIANPNRKPSNIALNQSKNDIVSINNTNGFTIHV